MTGMPDRAKRIAPGVYDLDGEMHVDLAEFIIAAGGDPADEHDVQTAIAAIQRTAAAGGIPTQIKEPDYAGPWIATFRDGPLASHDHDRIFAVGPIWKRMTLVEIPGPHGWVIVAGDGIAPTDAPRVPWDGEVNYRLDHVIPEAGVDGEPVACYELAQ